MSKTFTSQPKIGSPIEPGFLGFQRTLNVPTGASWASRKPSRTGTLYPTSRASITPRGRPARKAIAQAGEVVLSRLGIVKELKIHRGNAGEGRDAVPLHDVEARFRLESLEIRQGAPGKERGVLIAGLAKRVEEGQRGQG